ncbi:hypothetical protein FQR65_LT08281 [Abscondita terminalis]|nr:hypothetical protein FQR65_LT08281 [Abscondita terminalis]
MLLFAILICVCILFLYYKLRIPLNYWKDRGIPHIPANVIIGNLGSVVFRKESYNDLLHRTCVQYKKLRYFGFYNFSRPTLIVLDKELIKQIFIKNFDHFTDHYDFMPKDVDKFWKKGLFSREGDDWHAMRSTISPTFTTSTTFGINCDSLENENNEFYLMGKEAFDFSGLKAFKFFASAISPTLARLFGVKMFSNKIRDFFVRIVQETMVYRKKTGLYRPDVMHLLMEAQKGQLTYEQDKDDLRSGFAGIDTQYFNKKSSTTKFFISDEDIASQTLIFFFGSYDTVSLALSNTIYELVANIDAQDKLIREVDSTLEKCNGKITYQSLFGMKYLDMVISESLRLHPATFLNRICVKPFVIEPVYPDEQRFTIEPGTEVMVSAYTSHTNPEYFPNPYKFCPERFNDENKDNLDACTYFPFGIGPRHCIGNRFALMIMKLMIVNLLAHFEIVPVEKTVIPMVACKTEIRIKSAHDYWFGFKPRAKNL